MQASLEPKCNTAQSIAYYWCGISLTGCHQQRPGPIYRPKRKSQRRDPKKSLEPAPPRLYNAASQVTRRKVKHTVAAILRAAWEQKQRAWLTTISFSDLWQISDLQAREVLRSFTLRLKYLDRKHGVQGYWCSVAERQKNGTVHYHIVHTHGFRHYDYQKLQRAMRHTLGRVCPEIPADELAAWNGVDNDVVKPRPLRPQYASQLARYTSKQSLDVASRMASYLAKGGKCTTYAHMPYASNYAAKELPIGWCTEEEIAPLLDVLFAGDYIACLVYDGRELWKRKTAVDLGLIGYPRPPTPP